ncbi:MAG: hypothetical protein R2784_04690 [Saprospiraceae bacterium]
MYLARLKFAEYKGEVWVASGDYKLEDDGLTEAFEPVKCHTFITESTFGLPVYNWKPQAEVFEEINNWWYANAEEGKVSLLSCYSLGSTYFLYGLDTSIDPFLRMVQLKVIPIRYFATRHSASGNTISESRYCKVNSLKVPWFWLHLLPSIPPGLKDSNLFRLVSLPDG